MKFTLSSREPTKRDKGEWWVHLHHWLENVHMDSGPVDSFDWWLYRRVHDEWTQQHPTEQMEFMRKLKRRHEARQQAQRGQAR